MGSESGQSLRVLMLGSGLRNCLGDRMECAENRLEALVEATVIFKFSGAHRTACSGLLAKLRYWKILDIAHRTNLHNCQLCSGSTSLRDDRKHPLAILADFGETLRVLVCRHR